MEFNFKKFFINNKETDLDKLSPEERQKIDQAFDKLNQFFDGNFSEQGTPLKVIQTNGQWQNGSFTPLTSSRFSSRLTRGIIGSILFSLLLVFFIFMVPSLTKETYDLKGDLKHFDPFAAINDIRSSIGTDVKLGSIIIKYVRSDGTIDLTAKYEPYLVYEFLRELPKPPENAPPGIQKWYEPIRVTVQAPGWKTYTYSEPGRKSMTFIYSKGIDVSRSTPTSSASVVSDPSCSITDFWKQALEKGAPADGVANIMYTNDGTYIFGIEGSNIGLITKNCS